MKMFLAIGCAIAAMTVAAAGGTVKGSVTRAGDPVAGVRVVIDSSASSSYVASTVTDDQGSFSFSNAPVGEVHVRVLDANNRVLATGTGEVHQDDDVITVPIEIVSSE